jgi:GT2 family glycosyltransferase
MVGVKCAANDWPSWAMPEIEPMNDVSSTTVWRSDVWEDLVFAMLAVGGFSIEKVLALREPFEKAGLFDPRNLAVWDEARLTRELNTAGYARGMLTGMYAERLARTMRSLARERLSENEEVLRSVKKERVEKLLLAQYGIGSKVLSNFFFLRHRRQKGIRSRTNNDSCA